MCIFVRTAYFLIHFWHFLNFIYDNKNLNKKAIRYLHSNINLFYYRSFRLCKKSGKLNEREKKQKEKEGKCQQPFQ